MNGDIISDIDPSDGSGDGTTSESEQFRDVPRAPLPEEPTSFELHVRSHSGPLPSPEDLAAYEAAVPGAGDRILSMAERRLEMAGRDRELHHKEFIRVVETNSGTERLGQVTAGVFIVSVIVVWGFIMLSDLEQRMKIASTLFPAVIAGANAYRAIRNMWKPENRRASRSREGIPLELDRAPSHDRTARD
ncbi:MAG: DUF2335 domain-containing protein [Caldilineaceae bacterium]|nr:DUF2335 domain-containing protein [Caldilineaceae bacterium]